MFACLFALDVDLCHSLCHSVSAGSTLNHAHLPGIGSGSYGSAVGVSGIAISPCNTSH